MLPFSPEESAARLLEMVQQEFHQKKSIYLNLAGYISYQIVTDVEFSSIKYIWNFLRENIDEEVMKEIKGMVQLKSGKGAVFDIPEEYAYQMNDLIRRHNNAKKKSKIHVKLMTILP